MIFDYFAFIVFNITFNNISVISWQSVLLVEETGGAEKTIDLKQVTDKLYHIMLYTSQFFLQDPNLGKLINDLYDIHTFFGPPWA
jgi:hypothetical protein